MREYRLLSPHKIDKQLHPVGAIVRVNDELGRWWVEQGLAERVTPPAPPARPVVRAPVAPFVAPALPIVAPPRFKCCGWK